MKKVFLFLSLFLSTFSMFAQDAPELVCTTPFVTAFSTDASSAIVLWSRSNVAGVSYSLQYKKCTDSVWTSAPNVGVGTNPLDSNSYTLHNLAACQCYHVRIQAKCSSLATDVSDWRTKEFKTLGCVEPCRAPIALFAATRDSMASLNWTPTGAISAYVVQWKSRTDTAWHTATSSTNSLTINHLQPCAEYQFKVKTVCSATLSSDFSEAIKFKTTGCVAPCSTPREIRAQIAADRSVGYVTWSNTGARGYEVTYMAGDSAARTVTVTTNAMLLYNVASCKTYKFKVRSICGTAAASVYSEWSTEMSINTEGCPRCESPRRLSYTVTETGAVVKWDTIVGSSITYDIQWMGPRDTSWRTVTNVRGSQTTLTGLTACTWYMFRVRANCTTTSGSVWSQPARFQTTGCVPPCIAPKNLKIYVADTVGVISWVGTPTSSYRLVITNNDNTFTREVTVTGNVYNLTGLLRCKTYKVQVKTVCSATSASDIVVTTFETKGCPAPCGTPREIAFQADTTKVTLKWSDMGTTKYYIEYRLAVDSLPWKRDSATGNAKVLTGLVACKTYVFRIASVCSNGVSAFSDLFKVTTIGCPQPCDRTTGLGSDLLNDTVALVKFSISPNVAYTVQYRVAGTLAWTSLPVPLTANVLPMRITGLLKCTTYQWRVLGTCRTGVISESEVLTFTTKACPTPCNAPPRDLVVSPATVDSAKLTWIMPTAGLTYEYRYALAGTDTAIANATISRTTTNSVILRGLILCRYYIAQVRTMCPNGLPSDWITTSKFRTGTNCQSIEPSAIDLNDKVRYISDFGVYPNPGTESLQVAYSVQKDAIIKVELMNLQGQMVSSINGGNQEVGSYVQTMDNVAALNTGIYLVVIRANGKVVNTQKWQKQ